MAREPKTLVDAIRYFSDPDVCLDFMKSLRWPDGAVTCPNCGSDEVGFIATRRVWECKAKHAKRQFTVKVGTIFEDSPLGLDKWLAAIWMIANAKNGVSSYEIHRSIGVTQKTAWFMLHRIRVAMQYGGFDQMSGEVEADETFIGGKTINMHADRKKALGGSKRGRGAIKKTAVLGILERNGPSGKSRVRAKVVKTTRHSSLLPEIHRNVAAGSQVFTDALPTYRRLRERYEHGFIDHAEKYVEGRVHTNGLENFWSLLKRAIKGTYVSIEPFHLMRYVDEEVFRFNQRHDDDGGRFTSVTGNIVGKRLTYKDLIGNTRPA